MALSVDVVFSLRCFIGRPVLTILECFVRHFQKKSLSRFHACSLLRRDSEEWRIEGSNILVQEEAMCGVELRCARMQRSASLLYKGTDSTLRTANLPRPCGPDLGGAKHRRPTVRRGPGGGPFETCTSFPKGPAAMRPGQPGGRMRQQWRWVL